MIRLRITPDGRIRGLWTDAVDFTGLGETDVRRASHVEFDRRRQQWYVQRAIPCGWLRRWIQRFCRRPMGRVIHFAPTRSGALDWERRYFEPGGRGWATENCVAQSLWPVVCFGMMNRHATRSEP